MHQKSYSLNEWISLEEDGLILSDTAFSVNRTLNDAEKIQTLFLAINGVFSGRFIYFDVPETWIPQSSFLPIHRKYSSGMIILLGDISEYVFLKNFKLKGEQVPVKKEKAPIFLSPWIEDDVLQCSNLPAFLQMKLGNVMVRAEWLLFSDLADIIKLFYRPEGNE